MQLQLASLGQRKNATADIGVGAGGVALDHLTAWHHLCDLAFADFDNPDVNGRFAFVVLGLRLWVQ